MRPKYEKGGVGKVRGGKDAQNETETGVVSDVAQTQCNAKVMQQSTHGIVVGFVVFQLFT